MMVMMMMMRVMMMMMRLSETAFNEHLQQKMNIDDDYSDLYIVGAESLSHY